MEKIKLRDICCLLGIFGCFTVFIASPYYKLATFSMFGLLTSYNFRCAPAEHSQASKMEPFLKIFNGWKHSTSFTISHFLDVWLDWEYISVSINTYQHQNLNNIYFPSATDNSAKNAIIVAFHKFKQNHV